MTIYDGGEHEGQPYLVMEPVEGESLADLIRREAPLAPERSAGIACQVAEALAYAHSRGIIHRDIKPQNVLLDRAGRAKVTDFGIAKNADLTRTLAGTILGTPSYIAPEVSAGQPATAGADIYALGVLLYLMLTAHTPFESDNPIALAIRSQREDPRPPSALVPLPEWLDPVVLRALARNPEDRYAAAADVAHDLARQGSAPAPSLVGGATLRLPVSPAASDGSPTPARRRRRRPAILWLLPTLVLVAAAIGLAYLSLNRPVAPRPSPTPTPGVPPPSGAPNLLANGRLTSVGNAQPIGWQWQTFSGGEPLHFWRPGGPSGSDPELGLESGSSTDTAWVSSDVSVAPGWKLTLTGFVRTTGVAADGSGASLQIACHLADGRPGATAASAASRGSSGWSQASAGLTAPPDTKVCQALLRLGSAGKPTTGRVEFSRISLTAS